MLHLFHKKEDSAAFRRKQAASFDGLSVQYVTERTESGEVVLGRGGSVSVRDGELILLCAGDIVFRAPVEEISFSELLSGNGVILTGVDTLSARERTLIAYFSYYRK